MFMAVRNLALKSNREANPTDYLHEKCPIPNSLPNPQENKQFFFPFLTKQI